VQLRFLYSVDLPNEITSFRIKLLGMKNVIL